MTRFGLWSRLEGTVFSPRASRPDPWLLAAVGVLIGIGLIMVFNASYFYAQSRFADPLLFFKKQLYALGIGSALFFVCMRLRVRWLEKVANVVLVAAIGLLVLVLVFGLIRGGARRWIWIGPFNFQPSELAKLAIVFYLARAIVRHHASMNTFLGGIARHLAVVGVVAGLIAVQPDFSTSVVLCAVVGVMLYAGGARVSHLVGMALAASPLAIAAIVTAPWRLKRVWALLDPMAYQEDTAFQLVQSMIAFGSGGLTGVGLGQGDQKMGFLPEAHTDFIFSLVGEDFGVVGALLVIGLFAIIGVRGFTIATQHPDPFARLLAFGITATLLFQAAVNIGVTVGLLPTTGMALPFVSYGGSALIVGMLQVGILAALSRMSG